MARTWSDRVFWFWEKTYKFNPILWVTFVVFCVALIPMAVMGVWIGGHHDCRG